MKRKFFVTAGAVALTVGGLATTSAQPAAAADSYLLKNVATGKCMEGDTASKAIAVKMVTCNKNSAYQKWGISSGKIVLVFSGLAENCLGIPKSPSGDISRTVVTTSCTNTAYNFQMQTGVKSNYPIASTNPGCYVGHYSSGDTWPSCYVNSGSNTRWDWVSAP
ncbi:ricin-type beta-trefoil lectin domain protein [Streptomyces sp. SID10853]|uniref:ricin-type beta-trefoil lectin domain protein n=1 Tax=Streptomyces sp. SID10853 TaxID=2706028 RepID=UPI0013C0A934|nr:ricin-type beta-trefoil lectin domain protein [Streptomyces sp. SID10853]NDZ79560.1 ricin-type beta-trefoil lectin domain protein [Streptomyces sp. SID10853]